MKSTKLFATVIATLSLFSLSAIAGEGWIEDLDKALAKGKEEGKPVLAEFTGSDWCPPCIMMHEKVFSKEAFVKKASEKFILAVVDIPKGKPEVREKNEPLMEKHKVSGVPTVILFDEKGKEFDRFVASKYPEIDAFLAQLDKSLEKKGMQ